MDFNYKAPAVTLSPESKRPYTVVAEKGSHNLAVSLSFEPLPVVSGSMKYVSLNLCLRVIEILPEEYLEASKSVYDENKSKYTVFGKAFKVREAFKHPLNGKDCVALRLAKVLCPLVALPTSPKEVISVIEQNDAFAKVAERIEQAVKDCEGTMLVENESLKLALSLPLEPVLHQDIPVVTFAIPEFK